MVKQEDEMEHESPFSQDALRAIAKEKILWRLGVQIHFLAFLLVNVLLIVINWISNQWMTPWFVYPLSGWIIGFGAHLTIFFIYSKGVIGENKKAMILHVVISVLSSLALFNINFFSNFNVMWFIYPVIALLISDIVHFIVYKFIIKPSDTGESKSWMERKIDEELHKAKERKIGGLE